jgi:hypothetical protein
MDFSALLPREHHGVFAWLGRHDWVKVVQPSPDQYFLHPSLPEGVLKLSKKDQQTLGFMLADSDNDALMTLWHFALSKCLAGGPKIFEPSISQCRFLEDVDLDIGTEDYCQPYDAMVVRFPKEYVRGVCDKHGLRGISRNVVCYRGAQTDGRRYLYMGSQITTRVAPQIVPVRIPGLGAGSLLTPPLRAPQILAHLIPSDDLTIEDYIHKKLEQGPALTDAEEKVSAEVHRMAMNCCMLLMEYKSSVHAYPWDRAAWDRNRAKKDPMHQLLAIGDFEKISLCQTGLAEEPDEWDADDYLPLDPTERQIYVPRGTHRSPRPHWRKKHWHPVWCGPGRTIRRAKLFRKTFVRKAHFRGGLPQPEATTKGRNAV